MKNWGWLAQHFKLVPPLAVMKVTQEFGANEVPFYKTLGMAGHNAWDLRAAKGTETFACFDGLVVIAGVDSTAGKEVRIRSEEKLIGNIKYRLEAIYYHLDLFECKAGDKVKAGQVVALTGNTGKYTTAPHLHFGLKPEWNDGSGWQKDKDNGYYGAIDPKAFLLGVNRLPVDERYGRGAVLQSEVWMRFKNDWLKNKFFTELKRSPGTITKRELYALVYGGWDYETVFKRPEMFAFWAVQTKADYLAKKPLTIIL